MTSVGADGYRHDAVFYATDDEFIQAIAPFAREGLGAGETVVLICPDRRVSHVVTALDDDPRIAVIPPADAYRRTSVAVATYRDVVRRAITDGVPRVRLIGDVDPRGAGMGWPEWGRFEAICNLVLRNYPLWIVCGYDRNRLPGPVLRGGAANHPHTVVGTRRSSNRGYTEPERYLRDSLPVAPEPPGDREPLLRADALSPAGLPELRAVLRARLTAAGVAPAPADAFVTAIHEVVGNALTHGRPPVRVRVWSMAGRSLCTVTDAGTGFNDPLAGYLPLEAPDLLRGGAGLALARSLCDHLSMRMSPEGFTVTLAIDC